MKATIVIATVGAAALLCGAVVRPANDARARKSVVVRHDRPACVEAVVAAVAPPRPAPTPVISVVVEKPVPDESTAANPERLRLWLLALTPGEFAPLVGSTELDRWVHAIVADLSLRHADGPQPPRELEEFLEAINARVLASRPAVSCER